MIHLLANGPGRINGSRYTTNNSFFDGSYVSRAVLVNPADGPVTVNLTDEVSANSENGVWVGFRCHFMNSRIYYDNAVSFFTALNANGDAAFRTDPQNPDSRQALRVFNSEGASIISNEAYLSPGSGMVKFDFHYYVSEGNVYCDLYRNGTPLLTSGPVVGAARGVKSFVFQGMGNGANDHAIITEIVVADEETFNIRVSDKNSLSAGTHVDWAGTVGSLSSANVGDVSTFAYANGAQPPLTGVRAIAVNAQMAADGGNIQAVLRKGGVDYKSGSLNADATVKGLGHVWNSDPSGGSFGRLDDLAALEFGVEHIA